MNSSLSRFHCKYVPRFSCLLSLGLVALLASGCGGGVAGSGGTGTTSGGSTTVTILSTSTANDRLFQYSTTIVSLTLTNQSGNTVSLLTTPLYPEFIHLNGVQEPMVTVNIPQGTYTSATASLGSAGFTCAALGSGGVYTTHWFGDIDSVPAGDVTVSLPEPITITGASMVLSLDLLVSQSASYTSCYPTGTETFSTTPNFSLTAEAVSPQPTNSGNGKMNGLEGVIASVDSAGNSFVVNAADGYNYGGPCVPPTPADCANDLTWRVAVNASTVFQGITGFSQLVAGLAVDMDATIQADGSLLATRIAVYDTNTSNTSLWVVPVVFVDNSLASLAIGIGEREELGPVMGGDA